MRIVAENLKQLLAARAESRRSCAARSQTMIQALDNNPLKFSPTPEDALRIMFGPRDEELPRRAPHLQQSFNDLKTHQVNTYSAMQQALQMLLEDLDPQAIEGTTEAEAVGALVGSRKARLWDAYVARWDAMTAPRQGLVEPSCSTFPNVINATREAAARGLTTRQGADVQHERWAQCRPLAKQRCPGIARSSGPKDCSSGHIICSRATVTWSISSRARVRHVTPYPWGFSVLEIDPDLAQQSKFSLAAPPA